MATARARLATARLREQPRTRQEAQGATLRGEAQERTGYGASAGGMRQLARTNGASTNARTAASAVDRGIPRVTAISGASTPGSGASALSAGRTAVTTSAADMKPGMARRGYGQLKAPRRTFQRCCVSSPGALVWCEGFWRARKSSCCTGGNPDYIQVRLSCVANQQRALRTGCGLFQQPARKASGHVTGAHTGAPSPRVEGVMSAFEELGVSPELIRACDGLGWKLPTPVQAEAVPLILGGGDVMVGACSRSIFGQSASTLGAVGCVPRALTLSPPQPQPRRRAAAKQELLHFRCSKSCTRRS